MIYRKMIDALLKRATEEELKTIYRVIKGLLS